MKQFSIVLASFLYLLSAVGCSAETPAVASTESAPPAAEVGHAHDEQSLGTFTIGELSVELAQGHGAVEAGKEAHLVVKLEDSQAGAASVRAWIGSADRLLSYVGKGEYAASHDDYDIHATAPDPLAADAQWWIEVVEANGTIHVGAVDLLR